MEITLGSWKKSFLDELVTTLGLVGLHGLLEILDLLRTFTSE